jgi:1-deoxy-D-xylulose-5-phosphate synthase
MVAPALAAAEILSAAGIEVAVVNARFIKPLDREMILPLAANGRIFTVEDNVLQGGLGTALLELLEEEGLPLSAVTRLGYPDRYIEQGEQQELYERYGLTPAGIAASVMSVLS